MSKDRPPEAAPWLNELSSTDRATAERWVTELGGEDRLRRIASAILRPSRGRGAPAKDYAWLVRRTIETWLTVSIPDPSAAAKYTVEQLAHGERGGVTNERLHRIAREGLEEWLDTTTLGDVAEIEEDLDRRGIPLRPDSVVSRLRELVQKMSGPDWVSHGALSRHLAAPPPVSSGLDRLKMSEQLTQRSGHHLTRFAEAFPDIFPPETPMRRVSAAYNLMRLALLREVGRPD